MSTTLYDLACQKLKVNEDISEYLLKFSLDDVSLIERIIKVIHGLLTREKLTPAQLNTFSKALLGLRRFPLKTPGLDIEIELYVKGEGGAGAWMLLISEDHFSIGSSGYILTAAGSDYISGPEFIVEEKCRIEPIELYWLDVFEEAVKGYNLSIQDDSDDSILDWENDNGFIFWQWIEDNEYDNTN